MSAGAGDDVHEHVWKFTGNVMVASGGTEVQEKCECGATRWRDQ